LPNKTLTATLDFNVSRAEAKLKRIGKQIDAINRTANRTQNNGLDQSLKKANRQALTLKQRFAQLHAGMKKLTNPAQLMNKLYTGAKSLVQRIVNSTNQWYAAQNKTRNSIRASNNLLSSVFSRLKAIAGTYFGIMGAKALLDTSDTITSAQNKLNYVSAQQLGDSGVNSDGSYSNATFQATQEAMDKMYASSQKVRMSYTDMMSNVSKSMALAGDAFKNNTDNAIRFQEIMAEAYAVGGASAAEMSSSMYQLIQALGAGTLAGDELRSVREGAPLAYQAIEEFVQGVYDTEESLKDLASQGKVTSDMVVAAVMNAGSEMDNAFAQTAQTFAQTWEQIKNAAKYAFIPVSNMLKETLNNAVDNGLIQKIEGLFIGVSKAMQIAFVLISNAIGWIADNWYWISDILIAGLITIAIYLTYVGIRAIWAAFVAHINLILIVAAIFLIVYALILWQQGIITTGQLAVIICAIIIIAIFAIGIATHSTTLIIIAIVAAVILWIATQSSSVCDFIIQVAMAVAIAIIAILLIILGVYLATGVVMMSIPMLIVLAIIAIIAIFVAIFLKYTEQITGFVYAAGAFIYNLITGVINSILQFIWTYFVEPFIGIIEFILNCCNGGFNSFGDAVASLIGNIISWFLSLGKVVTKIIDAIFGTDWTSGLSALQDSVLEWGKNENAITLSREAPTVQSIAGAAGLDLPDRFNVGDAYDAGYEKGGEIQNKINSFTDVINGKGDGLRDKLNGALNMDGIGGSPSILDGLGEKLGLDFGDMAGGFPNASDPAYDVSNAYGTPNMDELLAGVDGINDSTSSMADSMDLSNDDLEYLRRIADMEWRNEFTTAEIRVDMTNNNTVQSERDLDGIVEYLSDVLRSEMTNVAYGVHY